VLVKRHDQYGKYKTGVPVLNGHKRAVLDMDWNPFHENILATGSDDCTVKVFGIPEEGLTETISEPLVDLHGHGKKVVFTLFHPTASNCLATASADGTVKLWDVEEGEELAHSLTHPKLIQDLKWNYDGSLIGTACKDKKWRLIDPRSGEETASCSPHDGAKCFKGVFLGNDTRFATTGFTRASKRQLKIWDQRKLEGKPLKTIDIDTASGVLLPFYDAGTKVLYIGGKGDGNIRAFEMVGEKPYAFPITEARSKEPAKGMCFLPKRTCNVMKVEVARCLKLTKDAVLPMSFFIPRKSEAFQDDLFPEDYAGVAAHDVSDWFAGADKPPVTMSLDPEGGGASAAAAASPKASSKSKAQLKKELAAALARIEELEAEVASLKGE